MEKSKHKFMVQTVIAPDDDDDEYPIDVVSADVIENWHWCWQTALANKINKTVPTIISTTLVEQ